MSRVVIGVEGARERVRRVGMEVEGVRERKSVYVRVSWISAWTLHLVACVSVGPRIRGQHSIFAEEEGWQIVLLKQDLSQLLSLHSRVPLEKKTTNS